MRRFLFLAMLVLILVLAACGNKKDNSDGGSGGGNNNTATTTIPTDQPTATSIPAITNPTLPPAATIDVSNPNGNTTSSGAVTSQPSPQPTRGGGSTLPPTWTPSSGVAATAITPSAIPPTVIQPTIGRLEICINFAPDYTRNVDQHIVSTDLTIYWFPVDGEGITYVVELYNVAGVVVYSTEIPETQVTFAADLFPTRGTYYWNVRAKQNGVDVPCGAIDNEIFVNG
ncbi:MAG: hypothetical protein HY862_07340 [Chloroflexi bacterium]|nr:hypothetical protein [Chloroflexota bacterium]